MPDERNELTRQAPAPRTIVDPAADWVASNVVLKAGQWGFEADTGQVKLGDGTTAWNDLDYFGEAEGGGLNLAGEDSTVNSLRAAEDATPGLNAGGFAAGSYAPVSIHPNSRGSLVAGYFGPGASLELGSSANGATVIGNRSFATTNVSGRGAFVSGYAGGNNTVSGNGAHLLGALPYGQNANLTGNGSAFIGYKGYDITFPADGVVASGKGAIVLGSSPYGPDKMQATADGAVQVGAGVNNQEFSLAVGAALRLNAAVPTTEKRNGDIWMDGNDVFIRSGGVDKNITTLT